MTDENKQIKTEEKIKIETPEDKNKASERTLRLIVVGLTIFLIIALILIKVANPTLEWKWVLIIIGIILAVSTLTFFAFTIFRALTNKKEAEIEEKKKETVSLATARAMCLSALTNGYYGNHVAKIIEEKIVFAGKVNKNKIYVACCKMLYDEISKETNDRTKWCYILINMNDADNSRAVLIEPTGYELNKTINGLCDFPEDEPEVREIVRRNSMLGTEETIRERLRKEEKENKNAKAGDLE